MDNVVHAKRHASAIRMSSLNTLPNLNKEADVGLVHTLSVLGRVENDAEPPLENSDKEAINHLFDALDVNHDHEVSVIEFMIGLRVVISRLGPNFAHSAPMNIFNRINAGSTKAGFVSRSLFYKQVMRIQDPIINKIIRACALDANVSVTAGVAISSPDYQKNHQPIWTSELKKSMSMHEHIRDSIHIFNAASDLMSSPKINNINGSNTQVLLNEKQQHEFMVAENQRLRKELEIEKKERRMLESNKVEKVSLSRPIPSASNDEEVKRLRERNRILLVKLRSTERDVSLLMEFCAKTMGREQLYAVAKKLRERVFSNVSQGTNRTRTTR